MADQSPPPQSPLKAVIQRASKKPSQNTLSATASTDSNNSANSSKLSLNHAATFQPDDSGKLHRDVGERVAGLFSRRIKGRIILDVGDDNDSDTNPRGRSRDPGSERSSLMAFDSDDEHRNGSQRNFPNHSEELLGQNIRRGTSPAVEMQSARNRAASFVGERCNPAFGYISDTVAAEDAPNNIIPKPILKAPGTPARNNTRSRRGASLTTETMLTFDSPETLVTPPTPTDSSGGHAHAHFTSGARKGRSGSLSYPSKLSQSMSAPLTPAIEVATPGPSPNPDTGRFGDVGSGNNNNSGNNTAGGFFQSMFSAAQNAATTLSNTVASNIAKGDIKVGPGQGLDSIRPRSGTTTDRALSTQADAPTNDSVEGKLEEPRKKLAVETLGYGELSLNSLGISPSVTRLDVNNSTPSIAVSRVNGIPDNSRSTETNGTHPGTDNEDLQPFAPLHTSGDSSVDQPYPSTKYPPKTPMAEDASFYSPNNTYTGYNTPGNENNTPTGDDMEEWIPSAAAGESIKRSGSARSNRASNLVGQIRRPRGSSAASSLASHLPSTQTPLSPAGSTTATGPKITGFAVASKKRNRDFHTLFRSVPEDDYLIEDYGCALQKDILVHGRLYVSEGHICFNSNILGWVNTLVISFDEVMAIEKKSTALLFPNAIVIQTLHARNVFASFISRDTTYDLLVNIWKISHPGLIPSQAGLTLEKPDQKPGDKDGSGKDGDLSDDEYDEDEDEYEDGEEDDGDGEGDSFQDAKDSYGDIAASGTAPNGAAFAFGSDAGTRGVDGPSGAAAGTVSGGADAKAQDFPGPASHGATDCGDQELHYERVVCEEYFAGPLGKIYSLLFGSQSHTFLTQFFEDQKVMELSIPNNGEWAVDPAAGGKKTRGYSYIRPLGGSIGPKQTKCICTEQLEQMDLEKCVSVLVTTHTPDVPSGNQFCVKTRYCLMWGDGSTTGAAAETKMILNCTVEWSGKSWLKGPIEKGCNDGQISHGKDLSAALRRELEKSAASMMVRAKGGKGGKGKKRSGTKGAGAAPTQAQVAAAAKAKSEKEEKERQEREAAAWGLLLPLKPVLGPVVEFFPGGGMGLFGFTVLLFALFFLKGWFFGGNKSHQHGHGYPPFSTPGRPSGYGNPAYWEHAWQSEEQELWSWLEDRIGLSTETSGDAVVAPTQEQRRKRSWDKLSKAEKSWMSDLYAKRGASADKEVDQAIEMMERRLEILRDIAGKNKKARAAGESGAK